ALVPLPCPLPIRGRLSFLGRLYRVVDQDQVVAETRNAATDAGRDIAAPVAGEVPPLHLTEIRGDPDVRERPLRLGGLITRLPRKAVGQVLGVGAGDDAVVGIVGEVPDREMDRRQLTLSVSWR